MIPKYYFARMILQDEELTADIQPQPPLSPLQCYQKRCLDIQRKIDEAIRALPELAGPDILEIVEQREEILRRLNRHGSLWMNHRDQPFGLLLQRILRVTPAMIAGYSEALGRILLEDVTILLDDGRTKLRIGEREYIAKTVLDSDYLSTEKCREIVEKLKDYACFPEKISFYLPKGELWDYFVAEDRLQKREEADGEDQFRRKMLQLR